MNTPPFSDPRTAPISVGLVELPSHFLLAAVATVAARLAFRRQHRAIIQEHCNLPGLEDHEEDFPLKLGLRYCWKRIGNRQPIRDRLLIAGNRASPSSGLSR